MNSKSKFTCYVFEHTGRGTTKFLEKGEYTSVEVEILALQEKKEVWITVPGTYQNFRYALVWGADPENCIDWTYGRLIEGEEDLRQDNFLVEKTLSDVLKRVQLMATGLEKYYKAASDPDPENLSDGYRATANYIPVLQELFEYGYTKPKES